jgi:hypothetical protein
MYLGRDLARDLLNARAEAPMLVALVPLALPCDWMIYDDYGDGSTDGVQQGGTFVTGGWRPDGGTITYALDDVTSGQITMRLSNVDESGVSQHDLLELFSGDDGSFSDSRRDDFLQVKFAGDIYDGYDGRVKLQAGPEWYGDVEVGAWTSEYDWDASRSYDFTIAWGGTVASMDIASELSTSIDYGYYGELSFRTLRVPNDGSYTRDGLMDDIVIAGVSLCGSSATSSGTGGGDTGGSAPADTDTPTTGDGGDTGTPSTGTDPAPTIDPPVIATFDVAPRDVAPGEPWVVEWAVTGDVLSRGVCTRGAGPYPTCVELDEDTGRMALSTEGLAEGDYRAWLVATGSLGEVSSGEVRLTIRAGEAAGGCATTSGHGGWLALVGAVLGVGRGRGGRNRPGR